MIRERVQSEDSVSFKLNDAERLMWKRLAKTLGHGCSTAVCYDEDGTVRILSASGNRTPYYGPGATVQPASTDVNCDPDNTILVSVFECSLRFQIKLLV